MSPLWVTVVLAALLLAGGDRCGGNPLVDVVTSWRFVWRPLGRSRCDVWHGSLLPALHH